MTIVCGTDFSENASRAARAAAAIARRKRTPLVLAHIVDNFEAEGAVSGAYESSRNKLLAQVAELTSEFGIEVEPVTRLGVEYEMLIDVAREKNAWLTVVAPLGAQKQSRWSIGSVAERLAQTSPGPVLIVREHQSVEAWTEEKRPLRALVGVEISATSKSALKAAASLREIAPCDLVVGQVAWPVAEHVRLGIPNPIPLDRLRPEVHELLMRDLRAFVGEVPGAGETKLMVSPGWGRVDHHLVTLAGTVAADLMVVGTHQRSGTARLWQGSVSRGVLEQATCNVLCVPRDPSATDDATLATFHRVLVPTDFSRNANRAIRVGYGLVAPMGVVHLLHVVTKKSDVSTEQLEEQLRALIPEAADARGVTTEIEVVTEKEACLGIWHAAGRHAVDVICMATQGRSGVSQMIFGSQAQEVVKRARQPVLLVPAEVE